MYNKLSDFTPDQLAVISTMYYRMAKDISKKQIEVIKPLIAAGLIEYVWVKKCKGTEVYDTQAYFLTKEYRKVVAGFIPPYNT
jgi:hypothetical protein